MKQAAAPAGIAAATAAAGRSQYYILLLLRLLLQAPQLKSTYIHTHTSTYKFVHVLAVENCFTHAQTNKL